MVYYGDWEQGPDYDGGNVGEPVLSLDNQAETARQDYIGGTVVDMTQPSRDAVTAAAVPGYTTTLSSRSLLSRLNIRNDLTVSPNQIWALGEFGDAGGWYSPPDTSNLPAPPNQPANAIGYEYETTAGEVVSVWLEWSYSVNFAPATSMVTLGPQSASISISTDPAVKTGYQATYPIAISSITADVSGTAWSGSTDITSHLTPGVLEVGMRVRINPLNIVSATGPTDSADDAQAGLSGGASPYYMIRPPRHRWLYNTPPRVTIPPLRQYPRSDGLGASSAVRHWPRPASRQASNRRAGGYF